MTRYQFPKDFLWGTATASYQVEGAINIGGRGPSIWDTFCQKPGKVVNGDDGSQACDHYHRYQEDCQLIKKFGIKAYRFSIAWPRIFPDGDGIINEAGVDFYNRLIDELLANGIEPCATLYHWDLPQALEEKGGWRSRATVHAFDRYANTAIERFGDRMNRWFTINEPWCAWWLGHKEGNHAPGDQADEKTVRNVGHHLLLAHGAAVRAIRQQRPGCQVGIVLNPMVSIPFSETPEHIEASRNDFKLRNGWLMDPLLEGKYPEEEWESLGADTPDIEDGDMELISQPTDFLGVNIYTIAGIAKAGSGIRPVEPWHPRTDYQWPVAPDCAYWMIRNITDLWDVPSLLVTENGCCYPDTVEEHSESVEDYARIEYLRGHLRMLHRSVSEGMPLHGYFLWSFMDNFEWAQGYSKRFGIVHVDFETQKRTPKLSAEWYAQIIKDGGL